MIKPTLLLPLLALLSHRGTHAVPTITSLADLPYNEDDRLSNHIFAYPAGKCASFIDPDNDGMWQHKFVALDGEAYGAVFGHLEDVDAAAPPADADSFLDCLAVCLEKGTLRSVVARPLPHRYWKNGEVDDEGEHVRVDDVVKFLTTDSCGKVEYGFVSYHPNPVKVYWVDERTGERRFNQELGHGEHETSFIATFVGHVFQFYDSQPNDDPLDNEMLYELNVSNHGIVSIGRHEQPHMPREGIENEVRTTMMNEWRRHLVVKRTFSALGFDKGRLPDDLYASLGSYYYNNRDPPHKGLEEWGRHKGVFVNYWETDVNFIQIPWHLKRRWQTRLRELVEAWAGVELETTDMYGMREYTKGARLLTHVDRESTHAASLIVNIAQENVSRPWTIEVHDHADRLHEVVMEPGDIVYYESAKALHGRNTPLQSGNYINLFTHYRPVDDPEWYLRDTPEGTPEPLMDVGKCSLAGELDQYSEGAVQCDNHAIGPHVSPTMFYARNGNDLFKWWKSVGPDEEGGNDVGDGEEL
eukprot:CAMPEP_0181101030 /NCGR_PEP_ID=MMETSP1071-20121207/13524_1 /TAXON_ID=35127 /ORGANISM="Thalassiosira sp., Strain NH16" /LENGTH=526 /DNA_ID=CAMNT_0023183829 /DNA_START=83 /DNA_END=1663 /DNA_ORIENTATION=-